MNAKNYPPEPGAQLRRRAGKIPRAKAAGASESPANPSPDEAPRILHEPQGRRIEVSIQNEELRRSQVELEEARARLEAAITQHQNSTPECRIVISDISLRKRAEAALRQSEERQRTILRTAMDGFWRADMQGRIVEVNDAYCRMSGYDARELLSMRISDMEALETAGDTDAHLQKIMGQGEDRFESRHRRKDGSLFDVEVSVQYQPADGGWFVVFLRDITERKQAREALKERIKELNCLYDISALLELPDIPLSRLLKRSVKLLPPAWRFPDICAARIILGKQAVQTERFRETPWMLTREITVRNKPVGEVAVCYLEAPPGGENGPNIQEEQQLLSAIAQKLGHFIERKRAEETLRILSLRLLTSQEEEQRRIAMELHDQTGQDLNVLKLYMSSLQDRLRKDQTALKGELGKLLAIVDGIIDDVRRLAHGLCPSQLQILGLRAALNALIRNFSEKTRIPIRFDVEALEGRFQPETQIVLYRIFQEALTNIYKHARAKTVRINVRLRGDALFIVVKDDGQGFDTSRYRMEDPAVERGMGLSALELRARMIGANLKISSRPGKGTQITLLVPLNGKRAGS